MTWNYFVGPIVTLFLAFIAGAIAYGRMSNRLEGLKENVVELKTTQKLIRGRDPGRYVSAGECDDLHGDCRLEICRKMDTIFALVAEGDKKRDEARGEFIGSMNKVHQFIGRVDEYIRQQEKFLNGVRK